MILPALQPLSWDSDFLGFPVARLLTNGLSAPQIDLALADARRAGFRLLYVVANPADAVAAATLRQAGAQLVDRKLTFAMPVSGSPAAPAAPISPTTEYSPQLESLAWQSGEYSRFRLDPHFDPAVFQKMYSTWLRNSLNGSIARQVLVWRAADGRELGLLTLGEKGGCADIGLLAVDATARGQRVGQGLVAAAVAQAAAWGFSKLQVVTQGDNEPACRFYEKCGFQISQEEHVYHYWLNWGS